MAFFRNKRIQGVTYDFEHLRPLTFEVADSANTYKVRLEYSCHVFTVKFNPEIHTPDLRHTYPNERQDRAFDVERYTNSRQLPELFQHLQGSPIYHSKEGSYFIIKGIGNAPNVRKYCVFFSAIKTKQADIDAVILVRSAYEKSRMTKRARPVYFKSLIRATVQEDAVPFGPEVLIKRR